jgi:hypothetical protein
MVLPVLSSLQLAICRNEWSQKTDGACSSSLTYSLGRRIRTQPRDVRPAGINTTHNSNLHNVICGRVGNKVIVFRPVLYVDFGCVLLQSLVRVWCEGEAGIDGDCLIFESTGWVYTGWTVITFEELGNSDHGKSECWNVVNEWQDRERCGTYVWLSNQKAEVQIGWLRRVTLNCDGGQLLEDSEWVYIASGEVAPLFSRM